LTRPKELSILDDPEDPQLMEELLAVAGAEPVEWPFKTECCGASFSITRTDTVMSLSGKILKMAKESGADCLVVACPLCQNNLDVRQADIEKAIGEEIGLPVFYFTQLLGRALGLSDSALGIGKLMTSPGKALAK
jgi:heterodisulfide reductase subunit B2